MIKIELKDKYTSLWLEESTYASLPQKVPGGDYFLEATSLETAKRHRGPWRKRLQYPQIRRRKNIWGHLMKKKGSGVTRYKVKYKGSEERLKLTQGTCHVLACGILSLEK